MVLHHNPIPGDIIKHCSDLLTADGILLITDLCAHDQDWVKQTCGDLWLGFEPSEITNWAENAGLTESNIYFLLNAMDFVYSFGSLRKPRRQFKGTLVNL